MNKLINKFASLDLSETRQSYPYKRINHFNEILSQHRPFIPREVYDTIIKETDDNTTIGEIRKIFVKMNVERHYARIEPFIINDYEPLDKNIKKKLRQMFIEVNRVYSDCVHVGRISFLNFSYVIRKCLEILGLDKYLSSFSKLKSQEKLKQCDIIWKRICEKLNWKFIASV